MSNKHNPGNWPLWLLIASTCMMLALVPRELAIRYGFDKTVSNVIMISAFGIFIFLYAMLVEALVPLFDRIFHKLGFRPKTKENSPPVGDDNHGDSSLIIDYAAERNKTLKKQEERIMAIEEKVIRYVAETMSPYISKEGLNQLIENQLYTHEFQTGFQRLMLRGSVSRSLYHRPHALRLEYSEAFPQAMRPYCIVPQTGVCGDLPQHRAGDHREEVAP